jgi:hypothetical protein
MQVLLGVGVMYQLLEHDDGVWEECVYEND